MSIKDGLKAVNDVITAPNWDMGRLIGKASERANRELKSPVGFPPGVFLACNNAGPLTALPARA